MKIDENKYKVEVLVQSDVTINGRKVKNVPCRLYLPEKIGDRPLVELKPLEKDFDFIAQSHKAGLNATVVGFDKLPEKIIISPELRLLKCETKYWGHNFAETTIIAEPQHLHIVDILKGHQPQEKTHITFWISPNEFLSPLISPSISYTGEIKQERFRQYQKRINSGLTVTFDKHFQYNKNDEKELRQWSTLVACADIDMPAEDVSETQKKILPVIDDFLLIVSLASKRRTSCIGWTASDGKTFSTYYRGNYTYPDFGKTGRIDDGLIEIQDFEPFIDQCHAAFLEFENKLALRNAIYAIVPSRETTIEESFLRLFAGLETLILDYRRRSRLEYVLPPPEWSILKKSLKQYIKTYRGVELASSQRGSIYNKFDELNRISLREAFDAFCVNYTIKVEDLWPLFNSTGNVGLVEVRNKLIHGDPLPEELYPSLLVAREHLRALVERIMVRVLRWDDALTKASPQYIEHATHLLRDMPDAQRRLNGYLFPE